MKRFIQGLYLALFLVGLASAQNQTPNTGFITDSSRALQFAIGNNFTLGSFQGSTISYKYHLQRLAGIRVGLSLSLDGSSQDYTRTTTYSSGQISDNDAKIDRTEFYVSLMGQKVWYWEARHSVFFYCGTGPLVSLSYLTATTEDTTTVSTLDYQQKAITWSVGINGIAGVEYFVSRSLSLHAEYSTSFTYRQVKQKVKDVGSIGHTKTSSDTQDLKLSGQGVRFGLSVYF